MFNLDDYQLEAEKKGRNRPNEFRKSHTSCIWQVPRFSLEELLVIHVGGKKCQLMTKSRFRHGTQSAICVPKVKKQHGVFAHATTYGVLASVQGFLIG